MIQKYCTAILQQPIVERADRGSRHPRTKGVDCMVVKLSSVMSS